MRLLKNPFFKVFSVLIIILITANQIVSAQINYKSELTSIKDFDVLKAKPLTNKYGDVEALKVLIRYKSKKALFY